ncbi:hypothetical protein I4U23_026428 [Adineta vaga]|nr:hypothetical protein I4U23_026428 [Adineta vaga]
MSINQAHYQGGLLLYQGEQIVNHSKNVTLTFDDASRQSGEVFRGKHKGKVFVTTHRMVFLSDDQRDNLLSFAIAFMYMKNLHVEQPIFGANYISGIAAAHPNGGFQGEVKFQLTYSSGGAIDASKALREVNSIFHRQNQAAPPSYGMAAENLYEPPPPSYQAANNHFAETTMYVSPAQAPYEGVYQRQPTGLPKAEYIPQYPEMPSAPVQYPPQPAYQNNTYGGQMYVPQYPQMPPSYDQSQHDKDQKKRD